MGDYDDGNQSGGGSIIGTIISILILAAIWPYLLAILGLYIAYVAAVAVLEWMAQNPWTVVLILLGLLLLGVIWRYRIISKCWNWLLNKLLPKASKVTLNSKGLALPRGKFIPTSNFYCYWCAKKLGLKAWEKNGRYLCENCYSTIDS